MKCLVGSVVLVSLLFAGEARGGKTPRLAVFEIEDAAHHLSDVDRNQLTEYLTSKIAEAGVFRVIPRSSIKDRLQEQKVESYKPCYDQQCQVQIGRELAANKALATKLIKLGEQCTVTLVLHDLRSATSERGASASGACNISALVGSANTAVRDLLAKYTRAEQRPPEPAPAVAAVAPPHEVTPPQPLPSSHQTDEPAGSSARRTKTIWGYVTLGVAVASVGVAAAMYGIGLSARSDAHDKYSAATEQTEMDRHWEDVDAAQSKITVGHVLLGVGAAALGASLYLLLTRPAQESAPVATNSGRIGVAPTRHGMMLGYASRHDLP